ncbi:MAG: RING-HC finger protein [Candidatus Paceibacterota bacterium]|jgi:hypothetical protein
MSDMPSDAFFLCQAAGCNRKYKTRSKFNAHMFEAHKAVVPYEDVAPIEFTDANRKHIEADRNATSRMKAVEAEKRRDAERRALLAAAEDNHRATEAERYRLLQEDLLAAQEQEISIARSQLESKRMGEEAVLELQSRCIQNLMANAEDCCICMSEPREFATIPCGHCYFCAACINSHVETNGYSCPICRATVSQICKIHF